MSENSVPVGKILKVWSVDRKVRKGVVSDSYEDLTIQCKNFIFKICPFYVSVYIVNLNLNKI